MYRVELKGPQKEDLHHSKDQVPNVPCGVESPARPPALWQVWLVPNVPCGVERRLLQRLQMLLFQVPNVPCGVESLVPFLQGTFTFMFLMYRVELKACNRRMALRPLGEFLMYRVELKDIKRGTGAVPVPLVPNVPCGVESNPNEYRRRFCWPQFLMYCVELKVYRWLGTLVKKGYLFLMYRVELKVPPVFSPPLNYYHVPNVPCELKVACKSVKLF